MIEVRLANNQDALYISENMRQADQEEFYKVTGDRDFIKSIALGMDSQDSVTYCFLFDSVPFALVGCIEKQDYQIVWACGTNRVREFGKSFVLETRKLLKRHYKEYKPYLNYVDAENTNAIRYLKHVGFQINEAIPYGKLNCKFHPFIWGKD